MLSKLAHHKACDAMQNMEEERIRVQDDVWFRVFDIIEKNTQEAIEHEREKWATPSEN